MQRAGRVLVLHLCRRGRADLVCAEGRDATLDYENGRTTLASTVAARPTRTAIADTLEVAVNDPDYYVAITFADPSTVTAERAAGGMRGHRLQPPTSLCRPSCEQQLYAIPPDQQLSPELAAAVRGTQGAILVRCAGAEPETAVEAAEAVAETPRAAPSTPFGGPPPEPGFTMPRTGFLGWVAQQQAELLRSAHRRARPAQDRQQRVLGARRAELPLRHLPCRRAGARQGGDLVLRARQRAAAPARHPR